MKTQSVFPALPSKQGGFSLVEALIAAVVVSVGLLGAAKFQAKMIKSGGVVKDRTLALSAANEYIEKYRIDYARVLSTVPTNGTETAGFSTGSTGTLTNEWSVTPNLTPKYNAISVATKWQEATGNNANVGLATYVNRTSPISSGRLLVQQDQGYIPSQNPPSLPPPVTNYDAVISGTIYQMNGNGQWSVSVDQGSCVTTASSYTCTLAGVAVTDTPSITIDFTATDVACGITNVTVSLSAGSSTSQQDFYHAANVNKCP